MSTMRPDRQRTFLALSIGVVLVGAIAFINLGPQLVQVGGLSPRVLPKVNAILNGAASITLIMAWVAIVRRKIQLHRRLMFTALGITVLFLVSYLVQHSSFSSATYGGNLGWLYYPVLLSHIALAAVVVPLVLLTLTRALGGDFAKHRKIARWTLPLWLYVSITGVVVYLLMAPYY